MQEVNRIVIQTKGRNSARSLCWQGDELMDWVGGGIRYRLDGTQVPGHINYAYTFDRAVISQDGMYAAIYHNLGTKGLLLKNGEVIREINRSFYQAHVYDYPIVFLTVPNGNAALVHCPDHYWKLEIEDVESGERLTKRQDVLVDFFQSRLVLSPDCRYLVSAGWVWHPFDDVLVYDLAGVLTLPTLLNKGGEYTFVRDGVGVNAAAFRADGALVLTTTYEWYDATTVEPEEQRLMPPGYLGVYDLYNQTFLSQAPLEEPAGTIMPVGDYVVGFYKHPKLISLASGEVVYRWEDLSSGEQSSSIIGHHDKIPPLALDSANKRFAVASPESITVIQLG